MEPIRILYLIDDISSTRGGSEQHLVWLLRKITSPRFETHFIVFSTYWRPDMVEEDIHPIVLGDRFGVSRSNWFRRLRYLARYIREHRIELVQAFSPMGELAGWAALRLARRGRLIGNRRDCGYDTRARYRWIRWLTRFSGTRYVANSEAARQAAFRNDKTSLGSITVIRNPVSEQRLREAMAEPFHRDELSIPAEARSGKLIGMVATVRPVKNYETLIQASKIVFDRIPDAWVVCVGGQRQPYTDSLRGLASELGVADRIVWYGGVGNPLKIIPNFDVAVLSSRTESFSNTVLEYAAAERPIVVTDVGGLSEIVLDGQTGFLVPPENPQALAEKIIRLLENPELGRRFGHAAGEYVFREYDENRILRQYVDFYRELAGRT